MAKQMNVRQTMRIKTLLAERRLNITSLAFKLKEPYGSVANTIYGHRCNRDLQEKIAGFLGRPREELFEEASGDHRLDACATGAEVSHG
jgi:hypothetical protein